MKRIILTFLSLTLTAFAFWPASGVKVWDTNRMICNIQMGYLNDGSVVIAWEDYSNWGSDTMIDVIRCQKIDTCGRIYWESDGILVTDPYADQWNFHMSTDGLDVYFVWENYHNAPQERIVEIYAQMIDGHTGQRLWGEQASAVCIKDDQLKPKCVVMPGGELVVTWEDCTESPRNVRLQWLDGEGNPLWSKGGLNVAIPPAWRAYPTVFRSNDGVIVMGYSWNVEDTCGAFVAQKVNREGDLLWDSTGVMIEYTYYDHNNIYEWARTDGEGGAVVLLRNPETYEIHVQRIDSLGQIRWGSGGVKVFDEDTHSCKGEAYSSLEIDDYFGFVADNKGGCYVWNKPSFYAPFIRIQRVDSIGYLPWGKKGITVWEQEHCDSPTDIKLCPNDNYGVFALFDNLYWVCPSEPYYSGDEGLYIQQLNSKGEIMFDSNGMAVHLWDQPFFEFTSGATSIPGGIMFAWSDNRDAPTPNLSLYAQIVDTTGKVGSGIEEQPPTSHQPDWQVVTAIGNHIVLRFSPSDSRSQGDCVAIFDAAGRLVDEIHIPQTGGTITWGECYGAGVYFIRVEGDASATTHKVILIH